MRFPPISLCIALAIAGCSDAGEDGRQRNVSASAAPDGPAAGESGERRQAPSSWHRYRNERFRFTIEVPPGFRPEPPPQNGDGRIFTAGSSSLRASGRHVLDEPFSAQIAADRQGLSEVSARTPAPNVWRAEGRAADGSHVAMLLARGDGRLVTVRFAYPPRADLAQEAGRALDSLLFVGEAGPLRFRYRPERFALFDTSLYLPGAPRREIEAQKLIAADRAALVGRESCTYGLSGRTSRCSPDQESGLAFAVVDAPIASMRKRVDMLDPKESTLAGRSGFRVSQGAEGEGMSYTFIPAGNRTIVVARRWRHGESPDGGGFRAVLRDLSFAG